MLPGLDTLRGIAIAGVFLFHVALLCLVDLGVRNTGIVVALGLGGFGVDLFFVLSGFLITQRLLDNRDKPQYFSGFFVRRTFRILPAYFAFLAFFTLAWPFIAEAMSLEPALAYGPGKYVDVPIAAYWGFVSNLFQSVAADAGPPALSVTWSLGIELQFYLLWPLVVRWVPKKILPWTFLAVIVLAFLARLVLLQAGASEATVYYLTVTRIDVLAVGALIACPPGGKRSQPAPPGYLVTGFLMGLGILAFAVLSGASAKITNPLFISAKYTLVAATFWCLVSAVVSDRRIDRVLGRVAPIRWLGKISYAVYLWHFFVLLTSLHLLKAEGFIGGFMPDANVSFAWLALVGALVTACIALLSLFLIERPLIKLRDRGLGVLN